jgi:hypothetical protein
MYRVDAIVTATNVAEAREAFLKRVPGAHILSCDIKGGSVGAWEFSVTATLPKGVTRSPEELEASRSMGCGIMAIAGTLFAFFNCAGFWWALHALASRL